MADHGYAPYHESGLKSALRYLGSIAGPAFQGFASVPQGAGFGEAFLSSAGGAYRAKSAAQQAAQDYAMKQQEAQRQAENDALDHELKKAQIAAAGKEKTPPPEKDARPWYYQEKFRDYPGAAELRKKQEYIKPEVSGNAAEQPVALSGKSLRMTALMYAKTGQLPSLGMGKAAAAARERIINYAAENFPALDIASNKADYAKNTAALTSIQKLYDSSTAFEKTALANADVLEGTLGKLADTKSRFVNQLIRNAQAQLGSSNVAKFHAALETVRPEFTRILSSPGATGGATLSDASRKEMRAVLGGDFTKGQLRGALAVLRKDASNRRKAYSDQIDAIRARLAWNASGANPNIGLSNQQPEPQTPGPPSQTPDADYEWDPDRQELVPAR